MLLIEQPDNWRKNVEYHIKKLNSFVKDINNDDYFPYTIDEYFYLLSLDVGRLDKQIEKLHKSNFEKILDYLIMSKGIIEMDFTINSLLLNEEVEFSFSGNLVQNFICYYLNFKTKICNVNDENKKYAKELYKKITTLCIDEENYSFETGMLGLSLINLIYYDITKDTNYINQFKFYFFKIYNQLIEVDGEILFKVYGNQAKSSPYISEGLSGVSLVCILASRILSKQDNEEEFVSTLENINRKIQKCLSKISLTQNIGLIDGGTGVSLILFLNGIMYKKRELIHSALRLFFNLKLMMPIDDGNEMVWDYNLKQRNFDFLTGELGYEWMRNVFLEMGEQEVLYANF